MPYPPLPHDMADLAKQEAAAIMEEYPEASPSQLADELVQRLEIYDQGAEFGRSVIAILRRRTFRVV